MACSPNWLAKRTKQIRETSSTRAGVYHATFTGSNVFRRMSGPLLLGWRRGMGDLSSTARSAQL